MGRRAKKITASDSIKVVIRTPAEVEYFSRGFYQAEEDSLYIPVFPGGRFYSYLDSPQLTMDIDREGRLLFMQIHTSRRGWKETKDLTPPTDVETADIRFIGFRDPLPEAVLESSPDQSNLRISFLVNPTDGPSGGPSGGPSRASGGPSRASGGPSLGAGSRPSPKKSPPKKPDTPSLRASPRFIGDEAKQSHPSTNCESHRSFQVAENLIFEITPDDRLASIWISSIIDDRAAEKMAAWRKQMKKAALETPARARYVRIEIER